MLISYIFLTVYFLPISPVVTIELRQSKLLQFDLQLLVLPLQVHNHTIQEVDLMEKITHISS